MMMMMMMMMMSLREVIEEANQAASTAVLQQQRLELLAALYEDLERAALDPQAEVERQRLEVDAVAGQQLHVRVVHEADAVHVDDAQVRSVRFDLADVDHFIDLFRLLVRQLKRSCMSRHHRHLDI